MDAILNSIITNAFTSGIVTRCLAIAVELLKRTNDH